MNLKTLIGTSHIIWWPDASDNQYNNTLVLNKIYLCTWISSELTRSFNNHYQNYIMNRTDSCSKASNYVTFFVSFTYGFVSLLKDDKKCEIENLINLLLHKSSWCWNLDCAGDPSRCDPQPQYLLWPQIHLCWEKGIQCFWLCVTGNFNSSNFNMLLLEPEDPSYIFFFHLWVLEFPRPLYKGTVPACGRLNWDALHCITDGHLTKKCNSKQYCFLLFFCFWKEEPVT